MDALESSDLNRRNDITMPEKELLKRVLEMALHDYVLLNIKQHDFLTVSAIPVRIAHREVANWIFESDESYEWGFCWVCEHLEIDKEYFRSKARRMRLEILRRYVNGPFQLPQTRCKSVSYRRNTKKERISGKDSG